MPAAEDLYASLVNVDDITSLAAQRVEELHLDFKERRGVGALTTEKPDDDIREKISKALSGFANSDGGVLVIGVDDKSRELKPIQSLRAFHDSVQQQFSRLVQGPVPGVVAKEVRVDEREDTGVLVILIPVSDAAPHKSVKAKDYYYRAGESFVPMQHWQLADTFGRRHVPRIHPRIRLVTVEQQTHHEVQAFLGIENSGRAVARYPLLEVRDHSSRHFKIQEAYGRSGLPKRDTPDGRVRIYAGGADDVIHAQHGIDVIRFELKVPKGQNLTGSVPFEAEILIAADGAPPRIYRLALSWDQVASAVANTGTSTTISFEPPSREG